jgi:hypothetical protein
MSTGDNRNIAIKVTTNIHTPQTKIEREETMLYNTPSQFVLLSSFDIACSD